MPYGSTYTPFLADAFRQTGEALVRGQNQRLAQQAYLGDPQAMEYLAMADPAAAQNIDQLRAQQEQRQQDRQIALEDRKRQIFMQNQEIITDAMRQVAAMPTYEQALSKHDELVEKYRGIVDVSDFGDFTPEDYQILRQQLAPTEEDLLGIESKRLGIEKQRLELEKLQKELAGDDPQSAEDLLKIQELMLKIEERQQKIKTGEEKQKQAETEKKAAQEARYYDAKSGMDAVDALMSGDIYKRIYGPLQGRIPSTTAESATAEAYRDQIVGLLSLENRQKLKGQGTITDQEAKTLERAATILANPLIDDSTAKEELNRVRQIFERSAKKSAEGLGLGQEQQSMTQGERSVVRTGMHNGRKVIQYDDGTIEYAD